MDTIKLYSWNVNGLRAVLRKGSLQTFLQTVQPDVLCLQEIKCRPDQLTPADLACFDGYQIFWNPAKRPGYSGTAILISKTISFQSSSVNVLADLSDSFGATKEKTRIFREAHGRVRVGVEPEGRLADRGRDRLSDEKNQPVFSLATNESGKAAHEGRIMLLAFKNFYLVNVYTPNSKPDLSRLSLRHNSWDPDFKNLLKDLEKEKPVIACGDFNAAHEEIDLARPSSNHHNAGFTDEDREGITNLLDAGFLDTFRLLHPDSRRYSWWSHWGKARINNVGWRIDYFFISASLKPRLCSADIHEAVLGSDHCPVSITLELK